MIAPPSEPDAVRRVLIFLLGSLGDTIVALPSLHLIARKFPHAERRVLTHYAVSEKAASMSSLLEGSGLVHGYFQFAPHSQNMRKILDLIGQVRGWRPDVVVHLHEPRGRLNALRDLVFFRACGVRRTIGVPIAEDMQSLRAVPGSSHTERRAEFLRRSLAAIGDPHLESRSSWSLSLSAGEHAHAARALAPLSASNGLLAMSIGTKVDVNDWGDSNWRALLAKVSSRLPDWGLVMIGAAAEAERTEALRTAWHGSSVNLCGRLTPRESAAVLHASNLFVGHDSGPMHLAASVGVNCVGIFSARNPPGHWFPYGSDHVIFYKQTHCFGCRLERCDTYEKKCILSITADEVAQAVLDKAALYERTRVGGDGLEKAAV